MNRFAQLRRGQEGFTLIELLVVVAIIALLATFAVPKLFEAIGKSKKAPGQADMQTISSAMERFYMDKSNYPKATTPAVVGAALKDGYLKAQTSFQNGFKKGYLYFSDAAGSYYVMVDPGNNDAAVDVDCNAWHGSLTPSGALQVNSLTGGVGTPSASDLAACAITAANPDGTSVVTN
jgi:type II secretion system protein G